MNAQNEQKYALFSKEREHIKTWLGDESWIIAYFFSQDSRQTTGWYCGLIKNSDVSKVLDNTDWELTVGCGFPGCDMRGFGKKAVIKYDRFGFSNAEPLVFIRDYIGFRDSHPEISEEFRFFHNLYYEPKRNEFVKFDESGEEACVVRFENKAVLIRLKEIRQFLAIKDMHLALFFDHFRYNNVDVSKVPESEREEFYKDDLTIYQFRIKPDDFAISDYPTVSSIYGKKLISPYPKEKSGCWPFSESKAETFEEFIIGETPDGDAIFYTCDHKKLANYFGANPDAPHYATPVYFKREVLQKYYNAPERFVVEDSNLRCGGYWELRMDNNHEDVVIVYLGDLGRDLPAKERAYWKPFNIPPKGGISRTKFMRDFMAQPCDPEGKDLCFKLRYQQLNEEWATRHGWPLFLPLKDEDQHFFQNLRVLLNNSQSEFDSQVLALAKVLVDALNQSAIEKHISARPAPQQGIAKFTTFLSESGYEEIEEGIELLKMVQGLRSSGVAHLKGSNYKKLAAKLGLADKELRPFFSELLGKATIFMENLIDQTKKPTKGSTRTEAQSTGS